MLLNITNNRRPAWTIGVKITLILLVAALMFAGMFATAADYGRPTDFAARDARNNSANNSATNRQATLFPSDNNFLASLRFWERNRNTSPQKQPAAPEREPARPPREPARPTTERQDVSARQSSVLTTSRPAISHSTASRPATPTPGLAPEPSSTPFVERRASLGNAPLPEWSANFNDTNGNDMPATQEIALPNMASHVSYSFDTRDWVESFPHRQETREDTLAAIQATSLHMLVPPSPALPTQASHSNTGKSNGNEGNDDNKGSDWDGHATRIATITSLRDEINKLQQFDQTANSPITSASPHVAVTPAEKPQIDLSPSYQRRLPHIQTCGVVVVQANFPLTEIASILDEIYMLQHDLTRYIGVPAPQEKIELCLFKDEQSYIEFLREFFPRAPRDRRALYIKLDNKPGTLLVQKSKDFEIDLRHEMTHAIIHASISRIPIWLDEGLAKYFEIPREERANNHPYMAFIRRNARFGNVPSLDRLARLETIDDMGAKEYREAWAWTHFLIHRSPETHRLLAAYLQMLATHPEESAKTDSRSSLGVVGIFTEGRKQPPIPSLKLYLDDILSNQRESFREHFGAMER